jgi:hypothetical protein
MCLHFFKSATLPSLPWFLAAYNNTFVCVAEVDYSLDALERRMVVDPCEQYGRSLDVPHKRSKVSE